MTAPKTKKKKKRRQRRARFLVVLLLVVTGIVLSTTVFFRITNIEVRGQLNHYSKQQITEASGISVGMNLFRFSTKERESDMWNKLPYIETVTVKRSLPGTVIIEVTETKGLLAAPITGGCAVLSRSLKVLEVTSYPPDGAITVLGLDPVDPVAGGQLQTEMAENADYLKTLVAALEQYGLSERVTEIDVTDKLNYSLVYDGRLFVMIGTANYADYKINMLAEVVLNRLTDADTGYIDLSTAGKAVFKRGTLTPEDPEEEREPEGETEDDVVFIDEDPENMPDEDT